MNILVCIKQVPQTETATTPSSDQAWIVRGGHTEYKMNRFDEYALEEALLIKEKRSGVRVDVITLGPDRARDVVKRAFGMGADEGVHLLNDDKTYTDPGEIAARIGREAAQKNYDLIITGIMSEDMMQAQTGQMLAETLGWPCVTSVVDLVLGEDGQSLHVKREMEGGMRSLVKASLPCVLTVQAGINTPRYPTLSKILAANDKEVRTLADQGPEPAQTCAGVRYPAKQREGLVLEGSRTDKVRALSRILRQKSIMR